MAVTYGHRDGFSSGVWLLWKSMAVKRGSTVCTIIIIILTSERFSAVFTQSCMQYTLHNNIITHVIGIGIYIIIMPGPKLINLGYHFCCS